MQIFSFFKTSKTLLSRTLYGFYGIVLLYVSLCLMSTSSQRLLQQIFSPFQPYVPFYVVKFYEILSIVKVDINNNEVILPAFITIIDENHSEKSVLVGLVYEVVLNSAEGFYDVRKIINKNQLFIRFSTSPVPDNCEQFCHLTSSTMKHVTNLAEKNPNTDIIFVLNNNDIDTTYAYSRKKYILTKDTTNDRDSNLLGLQLSPPITNN